MRCKERPILFTGSMVRALLEGRKTQTRRVVKPQPERDPSAQYGVWFPATTSKRKLHYANEHHFRKGMPHDWCPYGQPGDRLWVREAHRFEERGVMSVLHCVYAADGHAADMFDAPWVPTLNRNRPPMFLPRWASRITLELTGMRVERVRDISETDAVAEGLEFRGGWWSGSNHSVKGTPKVFPNARDAFFDLFYNLRKRADPNENPWVWVLEFKRVEAGK